LKFVDLAEDTRLRIRGWILREASAPNTRKVVVAAKMNPIIIGSGTPTTPIKAAPIASGKAATIQTKQPDPLPKKAESPQITASAVSSLSVVPPVKPYTRSSLLSSPVALFPPVRKKASTPSKTAPRKFVAFGAKIVGVAGLCVATAALAFYFGHKIGLSRGADAANVVSTPSLVPAQPQLVESSPSSSGTSVPSIEAPEIGQDVVHPAVDTSPQPPAFTYEFQNSPLSNEEKKADAPASKPVVVTQVAPISEKSKRRAALSGGLLQLPRAKKEINMNRDPRAIAFSDAAMPNASLTIDPLGVFTGTGLTPVPPHSNGRFANLGFQAPVLVQRVAPAYSRAAKTAGVEGNVELRAIIGKDGVPRDISVTKGDPRLSASAVEAIRKWRYTPAHSWHSLIEAPTFITIEFRINH
jgi:TonB family protein